MAVKINIEGASLVELSKTLKELREQQKALTSEGTAAYAAFETEIENVNAALSKQIEEYETAGKAVSEIRKEYKVLKDLQGEAQTEEDMLKFGIAAAKAKDQMADLNEQVSVFAAGSQFEQAGNALGQVNDALLNLDFSKAADRAKSLSGIVQGISFKTATAGLKDLGSTFIQLGKALLTNPLFLIAAVIAGIVIAIVQLLDKIGVLKAAAKALGAVFDALMVPINAIIDSLKSLTDWLGITNNAAEESAQRQADAASKAADAQSKYSEERIQQLDNQIRLLELEGKSTVQAEREKVQALRKTAEERAKADRLAYEAALIKGELSKEEIADLKEVARQSRLAYQQAVDDVKFFEAEVKKTKDVAKKKEKEDQDKADREKAIAAQKEYNARRLATVRQLQDLELDLLDDGLDKELLSNQYKYDRLIEDTIKNETLLQKEKDKLIENYRKLREDKENEIRQKENEKILKQQETNAKESQDLQSKIFNKNMDLVKLYNEKLSDNEKLTFEERKKNSEELEKSLIDIERRTLTQRLSELENQRTKH